MLSCAPAVLMPGHSVEEPAHRRSLCAQVMCSHASFISEPTAWTGTPLLHLHHADATVKHCAAVMGCRSAMLPACPSQCPRPIGYAATTCLVIASLLSGLTRVHRRLTFTSYTAATMQIGLPWRRCSMPTGRHTEAWPSQYGRAAHVRRRFRAMGGFWGACRCVVHDAV